MSRNIHFIITFILFLHLFNNLLRFLAWLSALGLGHHLFSFNNSSSLSLKLFLLLLLELDQIVVKEVEVSVLLSTSLFVSGKLGLESVTCLRSALFHLFFLLHLHLCLFSSLFISQESLHAAVCSGGRGASLLVSFRFLVEAS